MARTKIEEIEALRAKYSVGKANPQNLIGTAKRRSVMSAVEEYVSGEGMWINQYLRGRGDFGELSQGEKDYLRTLDEATSTALGKERTLYRSVDAEAIFGRMGDIDYENLVSHLVYGNTQKIISQNAQRFIAKANGTRTEKGFMSTSKSEEVASEWGGYSGSSHPIVLRINTKSSTKGLDVSWFDRKSADKQQEVLLGRGQRYKVNRVYGRKGSIYVDVQML